MPSCKSLEREIRDHLLVYLNGGITLDQFKNWLITVTWEAPEGLDSAAISLSYEVQLALADQPSGLPSERELRDAPGNLVSVAR